MALPARADLAAFAEPLLAALEQGDIQDKDGLHRWKQRHARRVGAPRMPTDADLLPLLPPAARRRYGPLLRTKPTRSQSGVAVVAVMSSPAACPHGKCVYCPGGPEVGVPQSYTGFEPSTMRAIRVAYDPYRNVRTRLGHLRRNGHSVDKVDIVIQGGTFPARDAAYRDWFVASIYQALNDGPADEDPGGWQDEAAWEAMPEADRDAALAEVKRGNETAHCRCIGLTIETKPDWCLEPHIDDMLRYGTTRVELGLQTLDPEVLRLTNRGHGLDESRLAMQLCRDAGLKICVHLMPGQPRRQAGVASTLGDEVAETRGQPRPDLAGGGGFVLDEAADEEDARRLFAEADWRPDMLKLYPCLVVMEGETPLKKWWKEGRYNPYNTGEATRVLARIKQHVPEYCRIQRVDRDIPTTHLEAGIDKSNIRQLVQAHMAAQGTACRCIRCREVGRRAAGAAVDPDRLVLVERRYDAAGGEEVFLALEDAEADAIVGFVRLRKVGPGAHRPELRSPGGVAVVRELKVYGTAQPLVADDDPEAWQHQGHGKRLMAEAARIALEWGVAKLAVIAGVGVKQYYRRLGYQDDGAYVSRAIAADFSSPGPMTPVDDHRDRPTT